MVGVLAFVRWLGSSVPGPTAGVDGSHGGLLAITGLRQPNCHQQCIDNSFDDTGNIVLHQCITTYPALLNVP